jgi:phenylacetate-CoA ligase
MPMIRYRTRDITMILPGKCECGRNAADWPHRPAQRRYADYSRRQRVSLAVETALLQIEGTLPHYQILLTRVQGLDQMEVQVEVTPQMFNDKIGALQELHAKLQSARSRAGNPRRVALVEAHSLERSEGKAKRVIDRRTS